MSKLKGFAKKIFEVIFVVQVDPWTREVGKKRVFLFSILVIVAVFGLIFNLTQRPLEKAGQQKNDQKRISDLEKLKTALISYQQDLGQLPKIPAGTRFLVGGKGSADDPKNNWLGVDLSKYLGSVPVDPAFLSNSTAPYPYRYTTDKGSFKLDAYLETNPGSLIQSDGGILNDFGNPTNNRARYEVGTNLFLRF